MFHGTVKFVTLALNRVVIVRVTAGRRCHFVRCCKLIIRRTTLMVLVILSTCSSEKLLVREDGCTRHCHVLFHLEIAARFPHCLSFWTVDAIQVGLSRKYFSLSLRWPNLPRRWYLWLLSQATVQSYCMVGLCARYDSLCSYIIQFIFQVQFKWCRTSWHIHIGR